MVKRNRRPPAPLKPDATGWPSRENLFCRKSITDGDLKPVLERSRRGSQSGAEEVYARIRKKEETARGASDSSHGQTRVDGGSRPSLGRRRSSTSSSPSDPDQPEGEDTVPPVYVGRSDRRLRRSATEPQSRGSDKQPVRVFSTAGDVPQSELRDMDPSFLLKGRKSPPLVCRNEAYGDGECSGDCCLDVEKRRRRSIDHYLSGARQGDENSLTVFPRFQDGA